MIVEFWVMRVLLHPGPMRRAVKLDAMTPAAFLGTLALVSTGDLTCLPDGCIAEPVVCFDTEIDAHAHAEKLRTDEPSSDYRVVLNTDVVV